MTYVLDFEATNMQPLKSMEIRKLETSKLTELKKAVRVLRRSRCNEEADRLVEEVRNNPDKYYTFDIFVNGKNIYGGGGRLATKKIYDEAMKLLADGVRVINMRKIAADVCKLEIVHETDEYGRMKTNCVIIRPID